MKSIVTLSWLALSAVLVAAPKFALVRVTDIYRELPSTAASQEKIKSQREAITKNERAGQFRLILTELQALEQQLQAKKDQVETEEGKKLVRAYEIKRQEAETLRQDFEEYSAEENKRINKAMVLEMRASLDRISAATAQLAKERNLDGIFDASGNSNTGVPVVLYTGNAIDLTEDVIALLGEDVPEETKTGTPETPEGDVKKEN